MMHKYALAVLACMAVTSCGSIPKKTFKFDVINVMQARCRCLIMVGTKWPADAKKQVFDATKMDYLELEIPFATREVTVEAIPLRDDGNVPKSRSDLRSNPSTQYAKQERALRLTDPTIQLFVLNSSR